MGCCGTPSYQAPNFAGPNKLKKLQQAYDMEQQSALKWAPASADMAYNLYGQYAPQYAQSNADIYGKTAPQYQQVQSELLDNLRRQVGSPEEMAIADQDARAAMTARGNINGDANVGEEAMNRADRRNQLLDQRLGQMTAVGGGGPGAIATGNSGGAMASGYNAFNPNSGPLGQQAALSLYQGDTTNAQNAFAAAQANNPFNMAMSILGTVGKIAGAAMM